MYLFASVRIIDERYFSNMLPPALRLAPGGAGRSVVPQAARFDSLLRAACYPAYQYAPARARARARRVRLAQLFDTVLTTLSAPRALSYHGVLSWGRYGRLVAILVASLLSLNSADMIVVFFSAYAAQKG